MFKCETPIYKQDQYLNNVAASYLNLNCYLITQLLNLSLGNKGINLGADLYLDVGKVSTVIKCDVACMRMDVLCGGH